MRGQLEQQLQSAYDTQLNAALAAQQEKLNATEKADEATIRQELASQISQQLKAGCLTFDDGSYFCVNQAQATGTYAAPSPYENAYAAKDPETGTQQIYFQKSGTVMQITHTNYDNIQPVFNKDKSFIAWQGLVSGRWQIFVYDVATGVTTMLPGGAENNISPTIEGDRIAWQGWDGNWDVFLAQLGGASTSATTAGGGGWSVREVTHDQWANVEPQLAGGLLAWQSYRGGSWQIFVDNLATGGITQVSSGSGTNTDPHFLLTWNSQENGQSQTLQYDIATGQVSPLSGVPAPVPVAPLPAAPATKNSATLPAGSPTSTSSSSSSSSAKPQGEGNDIVL